MENQVFKIVGDVRYTLAAALVISVILFAARLPERHTRGAMTLASLILVYSWLSLAMAASRGSMSVPSVLLAAGAVTLAYVGFYACLPFHDSAAVKGLSRRDGAGWTSFLNSLYFTTTTSVSVSYGDIQPKSKLARFTVITQLVLVVCFVGLMLMALFQ